MTTHDITRTAKDVTHDFARTAKDVTHNLARSSKDVTYNVKHWAHDVNWKPILIVSAAFGVVASGWAIRKLLQRPDIRHRLGLDKKSRALQSTSMSDEYVDVSSEDSFPASDAPSFTSTTSLGHPK